MCIASKLVGELESTIKSINSERRRLKLLLSKLDKEVNKQYHKIEQMNFNAAEGYCLSRELQVLLRKRRVVKEELYTLERLNQHLDVTSVVKTLPKTKKSLLDIHNTKKNSEWKKGWKDNFKAEEMQVQH